MANATITVLEADGVTQTDVVVLDVARQAAAASKSVALSTEDKAVLDSLATKLDTAITALQIIDNMVLAAGTANIGDVDVLTVPADPLGVNADAASATGSISAKLRAIATALGVTALDLGVSTGGSRTLRVAVDTAQLAGTVTSDQAANAAGQVVRTPPQEVHIGEVGGKSIVYNVTLSTDTAAYASGDLIADTQQMDAFFRKADGTGVINSITITDEEAQGVAMYLLFHKTSTSMGTENSAPNISDANLSAGLIGIVAIATTDWVTVSGCKVCTIKNIGLPVKAVSGTDDLYISALNGAGTPDWDADSLVVQIGALLD